MELFKSVKQPLSQLELFLRAPRLSCVVSYDPHDLWMSRKPHSWKNSRRSILPSNLWHKVSLDRPPLPILPIMLIFLFRSQEILHLNNHYKNCPVTHSHLSKQWSSRRLLTFLSLLASLFLDLRLLILLELGLNPNCLRQVHLSILVRALTRLRRWSFNFWSHVASLLRDLTACLVVQCLAVQDELPGLLLLITCEGPSRV